MNVYQRLNAARAKFHALPLKKTGHNKFADYYYFELGDFLIPALGVFAEVGLCGTISFGAEIAKMLVVNVEKPDECIPFESPMGSAALKGCHEVQNIGAVETYQRRYLWVAALEIVEHDALDATTGKEPPIVKAAARRPGGVAAEVLETNEPLSAETMQFLNELAANVQIVFDGYGVKAAYEVIDKEKLEDLQKIYLSTQLPSNVRNPITAYSRELHKPKAKEPA